MSRRQFLREYLNGALRYVPNVLIGPYTTDPDERPYLMGDITEVSRIGIDQSNDVDVTGSGDVLKGVATWFIRGYVEVDADIDDTGSLDAAIDDLIEEIDLALRRVSMGRVEVETHYQSDDYLIEIDGIYADLETPFPDDELHKGTCTIRGVISFTQSWL